MRKSAATLIFFIFVTSSIGSLDPDPHFLQSKFESSIEAQNRAVDAHNGSSEATNALEGLAPDLHESETLDPDWIRILIEVKKLDLDLIGKKPDPH